MKVTKIKSFFVSLLFSTSIFSQNLQEVEIAKKEPSYFISNVDNIKIFSGSANPGLAQSVVKLLGLSLRDASIGRFNDGEIRINIKENIRGCDVYLIQSTCSSANQTVNDSLMELFFLIRTCKRSGAKSITAVVPYFGYARQDRSILQEPISASDIAMFLEKAGASHVISVDLHCGQIQGFFKNVSSDNLSSSSIFSNYLASKNLNNPVIISPDAGGMTRAKKFRQHFAKNGFESKTAIIIKERFEAGVIEKMTLVGNVSGCDAIIIDDIIDSGKTLVEAATELKKNGASHVYACVTHPVFSNQAIDRIGKSCIDELVVMDTIPIKENISNNIKQISIAPILAQAINQDYMERILLRDPVQAK